jgi:hypothetical protein
MESGTQVICPIRPAIQLEQAGLHVYKGTGRPFHSKIEDLVL